jgi:3-oxoacyl-[acyl-carrier-protein] synthase II
VSAVVLGIGLQTAVGAGVGETWSALCAGQSGIGPIRRFDATTFPVRFAAEIDPGRFGLVDARGHVNSGPLFYDALLDAVLAEAMQGIDLTSIPVERIGVFMGAESVRPDLAQLWSRLRTYHLPSPEDLARYHPARTALRVARRYGARGPVSTLSIACTSSAQAVGDAMHAIRRGEVDLAFAGGVDVLVHPLMVLGFARLGALSTRNEDPERASRPFDRGRDGFVLGDGAGMMVLASEAVADRLGPRLGRITGYASTCNAWRITDTPPDGRGTRDALLDALRDAGRSPADVAYINAHGTSTPQNDASEGHGIRAALGEFTPRVAVSSTKSMMGHCVAACGVVEAIIALLAARHRLAPPTINLEDIDPECDLRHVPGVAAPIDGGVVVSNAAGFGGSNTSIVLEAEAAVGG